MNDLLKYYSKNNLLTSLKCNELSRLSDLDDSKMLELYNKKFLALFKLAITKSTFYKKLYGDYGITLNSVKEITDIHKLPIIERNSIKNQVDDLFIGFDFLKVKGLTSGTTGTPLTVYRTAFDIATEQAYIINYRASRGLKKGQPLLSIRGTLGKNTPFHHFKPANTLYISSPNINEQTIDMYYKMVKEFGPVAIEAYPSYLYKFCLELENKGLSLSVPNCFTSSETLMQFQRDKIEPFLQTTVHDWYGNVERTILLAQDKSMQYKPLPLYSINEFNDTHVISTSLINTHFPLIRYKVDDVVRLKPASFLENLINPQIINIEGRIGDNLILRDGSVVGCIDHAFKGVNNLEWAQVHQYDNETPIEVKIIVTDGFSNADEMQLKANFIRMLGNDTPFYFKKSKKEDLVFSKSGKYQLIIKKRS